MLSLTIARMCAAVACSDAHDRFRCRAAWVTLFASLPQSEFLDASCRPRTARLLFHETRFRQFSSSGWGHPLYISLYKEADCTCCEAHSHPSLLLIPIRYKSMRPPSWTYDKMGNQPYDPAQAPAADYVSSTQRARPTPAPRISLASSQHQSPHSRRGHRFWLDLTRTADSPSS